MYFKMPVLPLIHYIRESMDEKEHTKPVIQELIKYI